MVILMTVTDLDIPKHFVSDFHITYPLLYSLLMTQFNTYVELQRTAEIHY